MELDQLLVGHQLRSGEFLAFFLFRVSFVKNNPLVVIVLLC